MLLFHIIIIIINLCWEVLLHVLLRSERDGSAKPLVECGFV